MSHDPAWCDLLCDFFALQGFSVLRNSKDPSCERNEIDLVVSDLPETSERPLILFSNGKIHADPLDPETLVFSKTTPLAQILIAVERLIQKKQNP